jgi:AcrR family transcriptional regulator
MKSEKPPKSKSAPARAPRLQPIDRERAILKGAEAFFAEHGFDATTRDLAKHLGITQPLLYRYFPTKQKLIENVYHDIFVARWHAEWPDVITDRNIPLLERLETFYMSYIETTISSEWLRIFYFAGLKGYDFNLRYLNMLREKIFIPICRELRVSYGLDETQGEPTPLELEMVHSFHGSIIYRGIREHIYGVTVDSDPQPMLRIMLDALVNHISGATYRRLVSERATPASTPAPSAGKARRNLRA